MRRGLKHLADNGKEAAGDSWRQFPDVKGIETNRYYRCTVGYLQLEPVPRCEGD